MTRRIAGQIALQDEPPHPDLELSPKPLLAAEINIRDASGIIDFMIDTGADYTMLCPKDAFAILGTEYFRLAFGDSDRTVEMRGVGQEPSSAVIVPVLLTFVTDKRERVPVSLPIAIMEPMPFPEDPDDPDISPLVEAGNWPTPTSLLGRDVLQHFDLHLSYHPPSVTLTEASPSN